MTTKRIALLVIAAGAFDMLPAVASAAPNFSAMQINLLCPDFDGPMGAGNDLVLDAAAKRVYQGKVIPTNANAADMSACKKFVKNGKGGWFTARVTWSSDKNPSLYVENTAAWAGSQGDEQHELILFLDGNGNPADFTKFYVDTQTNIMNEAGLTVGVEVQLKGSWVLVNQQRIKPVAWSYWAMHSGDSADIYQQLSKLDSRITNINNTSNKYTDDQIADLHAHFHVELAAEATARTTGDTQVLQSANSYTDQLVKAETMVRAQQDSLLQQQDTILQNQIDGKVTTVGAAWPVTSTGGTNPVIGLAPCKNGEAMMFVNGAWTCSSGGAAAGNAVYNRNVADCGQPDVLTAQSGCTFSLPNCVKQADIPLACPQAPAQCVFSQNDTSQVCVSQSFQCDFWGCFPVCDQYETTYCGDCKCDFPKMGTLMK